MSRSLAVVKVGGSLYDLPDLGPRLQAWLQQTASAVLLVPGGGPTADVVRDFDRIHRLGEERAHWLALGALQLNAHFLTWLLPSAAVIDHPEQATRGVAILNAFSFLSREKAACRKGRLPHCWAVTSDAIAARAAVVAGAAELILLKSVTIPEGISWEEAARSGFVDEWFAPTLREARRRCGAPSLPQWQGSRPSNVRERFGRRPLPYGRGSEMASTRPRTFSVSTAAVRCDPTQAAPRTANQSGVVGFSARIRLRLSDPASAIGTPASRQARQRRSISTRLIQSSSVRPSLPQVSSSRPQPGRRPTNAPTSSGVGARARRQSA